MNTNDSYPSATQTDLFEDGEFVEYNEASNGQRFLNYLIDYLLMAFGISYATSYLLIQLLLAISPETAYDLFGETNRLATYVIAFINHIFYYTVCEKAFRGHTLGKLITGTRAIREDGEELTF